MSPTTAADAPVATPARNVRSGPRLIFWSLPLIAALSSYLVGVVAAWPILIKAYLASPVKPMAGQMLVSARLRG